MQEKRVKKVYLSGPIMDEREGVAREWREVAKQLLGGEFQLLDPMRRKFVDRQVDSANEIVEFDLQDGRIGSVQTEVIDRHFAGLDRTGILDLIESRSRFFVHPGNGGQSGDVRLFHGADAAESLQQFFPADGR